MTLPRKFLVIDDNDDARFLLTKTLIRKFPQAVIQECRDADTAIVIARTEHPDVIVVHRVWDTNGITMVRLLREANREVPIIAVSGVDRTDEAIAAGATRFLNYDEWLRVGTLVAEVLDLGRSATPFAFGKEKSSSEPSRGR